MKICGTCEKEKDDGEFHKRAASIGGLAANCKACQSIYDRARANNPDRVAAREAYQKTDAGRKAGAEARKRWDERNAIKKGASTMAGNAVRDGRLTKVYECSECAADGCRIHGHHDDYAKPLDVRWLCDKCHNDWHKENGPGLNG